MQLAEHKHQQGLQNQILANQVYVVRGDRDYILYIFKLQTDSNWKRDKDVTKTVKVFAI